MLPSPEVRRALLAHLLRTKSEESGATRKKTRARRPAAKGASSCVR